MAPIGEAIKDFSPAFARELGSARKNDAASDRTIDQASDQAIGQANDQANDQAIGQANDQANDQASDQAIGQASDRAIDDESYRVSEEALVDVPQSVAELLDDENRRERCRACYRLRLEEAARVAAEGGYDGLATTLAVSPYQFTDVIHEELTRACGEVGIVAHFEDYRPYYDEATRISRELGMYRQNYCGCRFSIVEGEATRAFIKQQRAAAKAAKAEARTAEEEQRRQQAAEKRAYAEERARRRAILKSMRGNNP